MDCHGQHKIHFTIKIKGAWHEQYICVWMSHESQHTLNESWVTPVAASPDAPYATLLIWMSHESRHTYECVTSHVWMSHVSHSNTAAAASGCMSWCTLRRCTLRRCTLHSAAHVHKSRVTSHVCTSHESRYTWEWVMSHVRHVNESWVISHEWTNHDIYMYVHRWRVVTYIWIYVYR